jgi:uncharacterized membrane protein
MNGSSHHARRAYRPAHPPFTAFPIAAYVFAAAFDTASLIGGPRHSWAVQLWHAGTFVLIAGLVTCLMAMGSGFRDLVRFAARRAGDGRPNNSRGLADGTTTVAAHVAVVAGTLMIGSGDLAWRLTDQGSRAAAPAAAAAVSLAAAAAACTGGFLGGKLVFSHGIGVRRPTSAAGPDVIPGGAGGLFGVGGLAGGGGLAAASGGFAGAGGMAGVGGGLAGAGGRPAGPDGLAGTDGGPPGRPAGWPGPPAWPATKNLP